MHVDEPRRDDQAVGVHLLRGQGVDLADLHDRAVLDADVADETPPSRAVDDETVAYHQVDHLMNPLGSALHLPPSMLTERPGAGSSGFREVEMPPWVGNS
jgi:hypothetical protein